MTSDSGSRRNESSIFRSAERVARGLLRDHSRPGADHRRGVSGITEFPERHHHPAWRCRRPGSARRLSLPVPRGHGTRAGDCLGKSSGQRDPGNAGHCSRRPSCRGQLGSRHRLRRGWLCLRRRRRQRRLRRDARQHASEFPGIECSAYRGWLRRSGAGGLGRHAPLRQDCQQAVLGEGASFSEISPSTRSTTMCASSAARVCWY